MDKRIFLGLIFLALFAGCSCGPVCNEPYIPMGSSCCLDRNNNSVCDSDDTTTTSTTSSRPEGTAPAFRLPEYISSQCSGKLLVVYADKIWLYAGESTRVTATFKNDGNISGLPVKFRMVSVLGNSTDSVLESEEIISNSGDVINVSTEVVPLKPGRYLIIGTVEYCDKKTEEKSTVLNVRDKSQKPVEEPAANATAKKTWTAISRPSG